MTAVTIDLSPIVELNRAEFQKLCAANPDMKLERSSQGELIVMSPTGGETGHWNSRINGELYLWDREGKIGKSFDSSTGFSLPNGGEPRKARSFANALPMRHGFLLKSGSH